MSTRQKKKSAQQAAQADIDSDMTTPQQSKSPGRFRPPSPTTISRQHEKEELATLNDRLAAYIDRVRHLEDENSRLTRRIQTSEEVVTRETSKIKGMYEGELSDARKLLDETARDKAKLQIDVGKLQAELKEAKEKYKRAEQESKDKDRRLLAAESQVGDLQARLNDAVNQRKHWENEYHKLKKELAELEKQLATVRKQLEDETVLRVDLQNRVQSLKEELAFKNSVHEQELSETRTRARVEIEEVDGRLQEEYDSRLREAVQGMRAENDAVVQNAKIETEAYFNRKLKEMRELAEKNDGAAEFSRSELRTARKKIDDLSVQIDRLRGQNAALESRVRDLENMLDRERGEHEAGVAARDAEIARLREALEEQMIEYRDLLGIKIQLDNEIATYRKLLESEETRLNISTESQVTPFSQRSGGRRTLSARKRKRGGDDEGSFIVSKSSASSGFTTSASSSGAVEINETDSEGRFIKLINTSDKDVSMNGWKIQHSAGDEEITYKFHRNATLKAGEYVTVWSSDSETTHNPPHELVMKNKKWAIADNMRTALLNSDGEETASRDMKKSVIRQSYFSSSSSETIDSGYEVGESYGYYQSERREDKCAIM